MSAILWALLIAAALFVIGAFAFVLAACQLSGRLSDEETQALERMRQEQRPYSAPDPLAGGNADPFERIASDDEA